MKSKKGVQVESEGGKVLIAVLVLIVVAAGVFTLYKMKGGEVFGWIKDLMRFGRT